MFGSMGWAQTCGHIAAPISGLSEQVTSPCSKRYERVTIQISDQLFFESRPIDDGVRSSFGRTLTCGGGHPPYSAAEKDA